MALKSFLFIILYVGCVTGIQMDILPLETFDGGSCSTDIWNDYNTGGFTSNCGPNDDYCCRFSGGLLDVTSFYLQSIVFNTTNMNNIALEFCVEISGGLALSSSKLDIKYSFNISPERSDMILHTQFGSNFFSLYSNKYGCTTEHLPEMFNNKEYVSLMFESDGIGIGISMIIDNIKVTGNYITTNPTATPTDTPTHSPTQMPTLLPSFNPTLSDTTSTAPTMQPTLVPTLEPTIIPTISPFEFDINVTTVIRQESTSMDEDTSSDDGNILTNNIELILAVVISLCVLCNCIVCIGIYSKKREKRAKNTIQNHKQQIPSFHSVQDSQNNDSIKILKNNTDNVIMSQEGEQINDAELFDDIISLNDTITPGNNDNDFKTDEVVATEINDEQFYIHEVTNGHQILNDMEIAKEWQNNQHDIASFTKGNSRDFNTKKG